MDRPADGEGTLIEWVVYGIDQVMLHSGYVLVPLALVIAVVHVVGAIRLRRRTPVHFHSGAQRWFGPAYGVIILIWWCAFGYIVASLFAFLITLMWIIFI